MYISQNRRLSSGPPVKGPTCKCKKVSAKKNPDMTMDKYGNMVKRDDSTKKDSYRNGLPGKEVKNKNEARQS